MKLEGAKVEVQSQALADAANKALGAIPDALAFFGITPASIQQRIIDMLPKEPAVARRRPWCLIPPTRPGQLRRPRPVRLSAMLTAVAAWAAKEGAALLLGTLVKLLLDGWNSYQANQALKQAGAAQAANKINVETLETKNAMEAVPRPSDNAVADSLRRGEF